MLIQKPSRGLLLATAITALLSNLFTSAALADDSIKQHHLTAEKSQYHESYEIDDVTLAFQPVTWLLGYGFSVNPNWTLGYQGYRTQGEVEDLLPLPPENGVPFGRLTGEHEFTSHSIYATRGFGNRWLGVSFALGQESRAVEFRSPNKAYRLSDETTYKTLSLNAGQSFFYDAWVLTAQTYFDYQTTLNQYDFHFADGPRENRLVSDLLVDQDSAGYIGSLSFSAGYDLFVWDLTLHPSITWSHTRTLYGDINAFQQSGQRQINPEQVTQFSESDQSTMNSEANPSSVWRLATSVYWSSGWLNVSRQHVAGGAFGDDVFSLGVGVSL